MQRFTPHIDLRCVLIYNFHMENKEKYALNAAAYDEIADKWHDFRKTCKVNKCVVEFCSLLQKGANVLDAGCGTGFPISAYLSECGFKVTGFDPSEKMLEKAKTLNLRDTQFYKADFLSFNTDSLFDAVIAFDCLWYIEPEKQREIYKKAASLLKSGGYFMFTHGKENGEISGEMMGKTFYYSALSAQEVLFLLKQNGFETLRAETDYKELTTGTRDLLIFAKKL